MGFGVHLVDFRRGEEICENEPVGADGDVFNPGSAREFVDYLHGQGERG